MYTKKLSDQNPDPVAMDEASGVSMSWLLDKTRNAPNFAMRFFKIDPGGHTPRHSHDWEHEVFVVKGNGKLWAEGKWTPIEQGSFALVIPNEEHQFAASETMELQFLCLVPNSSY